MKLSFETTFEINLKGDLEQFPFADLAERIEKELVSKTSDAFIKAIGDCHDAHEDYAVAAALYRWSFDVKRAQRPDEEPKQSVGDERSQQVETEV